MKKKTAIRKAKKKAIGDKQNQACGTRQRVLMDYGDGLDRLEDRNETEDVNQAAARIVREDTRD